MAGKGRPQLAASYCLLSGYCVMAVVTAVAVAAGATRRPGLAVVLLTAAVFVIAVRAAALPALGVAAVGWLFYAGFIVGRHGDLAWRGTASIAAIAALAGAALAGVAAGTLIARTDRPATRRPRNAQAGSRASQWRSAA
jgi:K+-sensing histidine kinase KdpD